MLLSLLTQALLRIEILFKGPYSLGGSDELLGGSDELRL